MKPTIKITDDYIEVIGHYDDKVRCAKMTMLADLYAVEKREGYARFQNCDNIVAALKIVDDGLLFIREPTIGPGPEPMMGPFYNYIYVDDNLYQIQSSESTTMQERPVTALYGVYHNNSLYFLVAVPPSDPSAEEIIANNYCIENISADYTGYYFEAPNPLEEGVVYELGYFSDFETHHTSIAPSGSKTCTITYNNTAISTFEPSDMVDITYNNNTIASITDGIKTLSCTGKYMETDVIIGDKTLICAGKKMKTDVVVEITVGNG